MTVHLVTLVYYLMQAIPSCIAREPKSQTGSYSGSYVSKPGGNTSNEGLNLHQVNADGQSAWCLG